jgi:hypothetical protein
MSLLLDRLQLGDLHRGPNAIMDDPARSKQGRLRPNWRTSRATPEVETYKH